VAALGLKVLTKHKIRKSLILRNAYFAETRENTDSSLFGVQADRGNPSIKYF